MTWEKTLEDCFKNPAFGAFFILLCLIIAIGIMDLLGIAPTPPY